jgi:hypothetical protein
MLVIARYGRLRGIVANRIECFHPFAKTWLAVRLERVGWFATKGVAG